MAAPTFVAAGTGNLWTTGAATAATLAATAGNIIIFHVMKDGSGVGGAISSISNVENLAGTDSAMTEVVTDVTNPSHSVVGSPTNERQFIWIGRSLGGTASVSYSDASGNDGYFRLYEFTNVNIGATLGSVLENSTAGVVTHSNATSATVADSTVTTLGVDRLALNFIGVNDDDQASFDTEAFTGQTGGTWVSGGSYGSSTGTDGSIGLQYAEMAAAGTIDGGTLTIPSDAWGVVGFALIGTTVTTRDTFANPTNFQDPGLFMQRWRPQRRWWQRKSGLIVPEPAM